MSLAHEPSVKGKDLTPRTAIILWGAGGTGAHAVAKVYETLEAMGHKFGEVIGEEGAYVEAVVVDGDEGTWAEADDNPNAALLNRSGATPLHLYVPQQDKEIRRRGLADVMTPGIRSEHDPVGCNADPRTADIRQLVLRESSDPKNNPKTIAARIAKKLTNIEGDVVLGNRVYLVYVGGLHGGTGPVLRQLARDCNEIFEDFLGGIGKKVDTQAFLMTSESADNDEAMASNPVQRRKRRRNTAARAMLIDHATVTGRVSYPDGTSQEGIPFDAPHFVNGRSKGKTALEHQGPMTMVAKVIVNLILQKGGAISARSNHDISTPSLEFDRVPANWTALGTSELLSDPSRPVLRYMKQEKALEEATGIKTVDEADKTRRVGQVGLANLVDNALTTLEGEFPSIEEAEFGSVEKAQLNAARVIAYFKGELPKLRSDVQKALVDGLKASWSALAAAEKDLKKERKIATLVATMDEVSESIQTQIDALTEEASRLVEESRAQERLLDQAQSHLQGLEYSKMNIFKRGDQAKAIQSAISGVVSAADRYVKVTARLVATQTQLQLLKREGGFQYTAEKLRARAHEIKANIVLVASQLKPDASIKSPFDLEVRIPQPNFNGVGTGLDVGDYSVEALSKMVDGVHLTANEVDLRGMLKDPDVLSELELRAAPLTRAPMESDQAEKEVLREVSVPTSDADGFKVSGGVILNAKEKLGINPRFKVRAAAPDAPITMEERVSQLKLTEDAYLRELIKEMITDALKEPAEVEKHFDLKGQMEEILPVYAADIAANDCMKDNGKGQTFEYEIPGTTTKLQIYKSEVQIAQEARLERARAAVPARQGK